MARRLMASYEIWADQQARFFIPEGDPFENNRVLNLAIEPLRCDSSYAIPVEDLPAALALLRFAGFEVEHPGTIPFNPLIPD